MMVNKDLYSGKISVKVSALRKTFKGFCALDIDQLEVYQGQMVALLGPSGSGKSTLLKHLSGLTLADKYCRSSVEILEQTIQSEGKIAKNVRHSRRHIGYIFQQFNLVNRLTTLENVLIGTLAQTSKWRTFSRCFSKLQHYEALVALERVGLSHVAYQRVSTLSGGQQQRVAIARVLMQKAQVILADEPIASLDPESSKIVMQLLRDICEKEGITVVVTLHQVDYAMEYCQRIVALKQGKIFYDGLSSGLSSKEIHQLYQPSYVDPVEPLITKPLAFYPMNLVLEAENLVS